jgi:hypothetical protein
MWGSNPHTHLKCEILITKKFNENNNNSISPKKIYKKNKKH